MERANFPGCCAGAIIYDLGHAHDKRIYDTLEEFQVDLLAKGPNTLNVAITNSNQEIEVGYLKASGFEEVMDSKGYGSHLKVFVGRADHIQAACREAKQKMEEKARLEREKKEAAQRVILQKQLEKKFTNNYTLLNRLGNTSDVVVYYVVFVQYALLPRKEVVKALYGVEITDEEAKRSYTNLTVVINSKLKKIQDEKKSAEEALAKPAAKSVAKYVTPWTPPSPPAVETKIELGEPPKKKRLLPGAKRKKRII